MKLLILCPKCSYKPKSQDRWLCTCGHVWNTFDTAGKCPACDYQWQHTQCPSLSCNKWSPHKDWYVIDIDDEVKESTNSNSILHAPHCCPV